MANVQQLPHLIKLLDDDSPLVRENVLRALDAYGESLEQAVRQLNVSLTGVQDSVLRPVLRKQRLLLLKASWPGWTKIRGDKRKLERALMLIAGIESGQERSSTIPILLDRFAHEFRRSHTSITALTLLQFLFHEYCLKGVPKEEYYNPLNSNLVYVIEKKQGIPISLVSIYILVGHRLGLEIEGCNLPGHFLAIAHTAGRDLVVDCYNGGRLLHQEDLSGMNTTVTLNDILNLECRASDIVARVLRNLINAYRQSGDDATANGVADLLPGTGPHQTTTPSP